MFVSYINTAFILKEKETNVVERGISRSIARSFSAWGWGGYTNHCKVGEGKGSLTCPGCLHMECSWYCCHTAVTGAFPVQRSWAAEGVWGRGWHSTYSPDTLLGAELLLWPGRGSEGLSLL